MCAYSLKINLPIHRNYSTDDWNIGKRKPNVKETCLLLYLSLFTLLSGIPNFLSLFYIFPSFILLTQKIYFDYRCPIWLNEVQIRVKQVLQNEPKKINVKRMMSLQLIITN